MHPILFEGYIFGQRVLLESYGLMNLILNPMIFVLLGTLFLIKSGTRKVRAVLSVSLLMVWVIVGARIAWVVLTMQQYGADGRNPFQLTGSGFTMFGGFVLAVPLFWLFSRIANVQVWSFLDAVTPGWALGIAFNKVGCHLSGCCMGIQTHSWLGVKFPKMAYPNPVLPVQLMEAAVGLLGFLLVVRLMRQREGIAFSVFAFIYAVSRLIFHFLRERPEALLVEQGLLIFAYGAGVLLAFLVLVLRYRVVRYKQMG